MSSEKTSSTPARQGFYKVTVAGNDKPFIAEWRERDKKQGKRWWHHVSDDPTVEKQPVPLDGVLEFSKASDAEVQAALQRELTVAEKLDEAYKQYKMTASLYPEFLVNPPDNRRLAVGDEIEVGLLKDCKVLELRDDGRVIMFSYRDIRHSYGKNIDCGIAYRAILWVDTVKKPRGDEPRLLEQSRLAGAFATNNLGHLLSLATRGVTDSPEYQRGYVWTEEDQQRYLDSLFAGRDIGRFILVRHRYPKPEEVLDGKQRLNCLTQFWQSRISWRGVYWHELSPWDRSHIEDRAVQVATLDTEHFSKVDLLKVFLEVNVGGVPQTEEHIEHVKRLLAQEQEKAAQKAA